MRIHTILTYLILSTSITATINVYASDWQISYIAGNKDEVFLIPNNSIKDTGIGSKSAKIVAINRSRTNEIKYYQDATGLTKPKDVDFNGIPTLTSSSPWDLASYSIEVDCDTNQYRYIDSPNYYYNGEFIKTDGAILNWQTASESDDIYYIHEGISDTRISEHANVICSRPVRYKTIKNLKSGANNLDWRELVLLGRDILKNTSHYYINQTNKHNTLNKKLK